ncbi:MAG: hypothetical protein DI629_07275 [Mesorhizobium amorphae]|nr:MAG: hypothetical protein DI629_07275 [Mesorhizobium amorphae]
MATKPSKKAIGLTPRVKQAIEALVWGFDGMCPDTVITMEVAAKHANISPRSLRAAWQKPSVQAFHQQQVRALRTGQGAQNVRTLMEIRDDPSLKGNAAGARARVAAVTALETDPDARNGVEVNVNTSVNVAMETAGYVIRLPAREAPHAPEREPFTIEHEAANHDA